MFYGWWVVLTAAVALFFGSAPLLVFSFGVFLKPLMREYHVGRAAISLAFTFHNVIAAISSPVAGRLVDHFGARKVVLPAIVIFGALLLSSRILTGYIWELYVFYLVLGIVGSGMGPVPYGDVISRWFDRRRGLALGLVMVGIGAGAMVIPSVAQRLITMFGWRAAYGFFGTAALFISAPVVAAFLKEAPEQMGLLSDGATSAESVTHDEADDEGRSWHEAWRSRTFWLMVSAFFLVGASVHACVIHLAAILTDRGSSVQTAALGSSLVGAALLIGRVGSGYLLDRFFGPRISQQCSSVGSRLESACSG